MAINRERARQWLKAFDFRKLFIEELGWDNFARPIVKQIDGTDYCFQAVAEKRGVAVLVSESIPDYAIRVKLDKLIAKDHFQHLIVFTDQAHGRQVWQWVRKELGKPTAVRTYHYSPAQSGELLFQKLDSLVFTLELEESLTHGEVTGRLKTFDVEKVTKKFYEQFKTEHSSFLSFIKGIPDKQMESWYASVMVNRLMFLYFIQEKGFLNGDKDYLRNKLAESRDRKPDSYYREFLCPLFFQGFARKKEERLAAVNKLLGEIPYLNGGLFQQHEIERLHEKTIVIADKAFQKLFDFFKEWNWHLDEREGHNDREINPDVLGYIFEKYINYKEKEAQKEKGAYYTKEDITEYIAQSTIIPFLLDEARKDCAVAFARDGSIWRLIRDDPDRYIHDAMEWGANISLPTEIEAGIADLKKRTGWNRTAPREFALPTEIWRETIDRHQRYRAVKAKLAAGEIHQVNDLVTLNLNIRQFAQDAIQFCEGPELLRAIWKVIEKVSVLDPTCGSGAFLFAALNILNPLYDACLIRMEGFIEDMKSGGPHHPTKFSYFKQILEESKRHPKRDYFILKAIIVNNLFGVDVMEEAVEICKLRLFLKLVAQVESQDRIEPLPDIDFNVRTGNTLVGYTQLSSIQPARGIRTDEENALLAEIEDKALTLDSAVHVFRKQQTQLDGTVTASDKAQLRDHYQELEDELNNYLSGEYGIKKPGVKKWRESHKPFHWFCDFHRIIASGGFDVVIGNPPYVEYAKVRSNYTVRGYSTLECGNLFAFVLERCKQLVKPTGREGLIVPLSLVCTERMKSLRDLLGTSTIWTPNFDMRPSALFEGVAQRLTILLQHRNGAVSERNSGGYRRWTSPERHVLFDTGHFVKVPGDGGAIIPKIVSPIEASILGKLGSQSLQWFVHEDAPPIYVHRIVRYFIKALDRPPVFVDANGQAGRSEDYKPFSFDPKHRDHIVSLLNSSLFYWFWRSHSDGFHCGYGDVYRMPFSNELSSATSSSLKSLGAMLQQDLITKSAQKQIRTKTGQITYQEFYPKDSKSILDEIDGVLACHYGFTSEELDFILNYDIKYRLGADADDDEE